ncbi:MULTISPECIES: hypothetical protein [unclassified Endozoicomonas]|uniref:hypothetical protein n=1 Tax=unclassified Endozoicomonas TaxID=2644528 RepID=UPI003BB4EB40
MLAPLTDLLSPLQGTKGTVLASNSLKNLLRITPMPIKTHLQVFIATLLCISFFSFAETVQPWKTGKTRRIGSGRMPVIQVYEDDVNGFIACYSHDDIPPDLVTGDKHLQGFVAMKGIYKGRIFHPEGYLDTDITPFHTTPSTMCQNYIPSCRDEGKECWADGNTGGYFSRLIRALEAVDRMLDRLEPYRWQLRQPCSGT